jgi:phospholipase C
VRSPLTSVGLVLVILTVACSGTHDSPSPGSQAPLPASGLGKVNHIIIVMMENHSFDNYFGALAYVPASPYHAASVGCAADDHSCVDGLSCSVNASGELTCTNSNPEDAGNPVAAFHNPSRCVVPDLEHSWQQSHREANFNAPNTTLFNAPNDGFVRVNDALEQPDNGIEMPADDPTMGFYDQQDLPVLYGLARQFAISDRFFAAVIGPTLPNHSYLMTATSFGHVAAQDAVPPEGFKPMSGSIFDLLDSKGVSWTNYSDAGWMASMFRRPGGPADPHFQTVQTFLAITAGSPGSAQLSQVSIIDPGPADDHPPTDIQRGEAFIARIVNSVRNGPYWKDAVIFITYDEHGGFYDHVAPPPAPQGSARTPDGLFPGQCADLSNPPTSQQPGAGVDCSASASEAQSSCPAAAQSPAGQYPESCASFDQLGFRVPFVAVSPFAKAHYVAHAVADHTSLLAFIERRFLTGSDGVRLHLTLRDEYADTLEDLFDFETAPSANASVGQAPPPTTDCTPTS